MIKHNHFIKGITLIEMLLAVTLMCLLLGVVIAIYSMGATAWKEGEIMIPLQRNASFAMEKMARGTNGADGIREARTVTLTSASEIQYTSGIDSVMRRFYLSGSQVMYDPDNSLVGDEIAIVDNVRTNPAGLTFSVSGDVVTISLTLEDRVRDRIVNIELKTNVTLRN